MTHTPSFAVGDIIASRPRPISTARAGWYSIGLFSGATGRVMPIQKNIHTDWEVAKSQGLPCPIADGMHSTNWISRLLAEAFGHHYIASGALRTKYIKITPVDQPIICKLQVTARQAADGGVRYELDVWTENLDGVKLTVGDAAVLVAAS